jgi:hypothetical protein
MNQMICRRKEKMSKFNLISVVTKKDLPVLKANVQMTNQLNQVTSISWTLVLNMDSSDFKRACAELEILESELSDNVKFVFLKMDSSRFESRRHPSYQHGLGMNQAIKYHDSDESTLIFLDPDFVNLEKDWIKNKLEAHRTSKQKVMGTSWDPSTLKEWIDFPAPHFFMVQSNVVRNFSLLPAESPTLFYKDIGPKLKFSKWANQSYETCNELRRGCLNSRSFVGILMVYLFFHLNHFRMLKIVVSDDLLHNTVRRTRMQSGILFEHFYSMRTENGIKKLISNKGWKRSPIVVFKYLLLRSESQNLRVTRPEIEHSRMEFLGENGSVTAIHARGVGANFETHTEILEVIKTLITPK